MHTYATAEHDCWCHWHWQPRLNVKQATNPSHGRSHADAARSLGAVSTTYNVGHGRRHSIHFDSLAPLQLYGHTCARSDLGASWRATNVDSGPHSRFQLATCWHSNCGRPSHRRRL
jgi:hypothetical protein